MIDHFHCAFTDPLLTSYGVQHVTDPIGLTSKTEAQSNASEKGAEQQTWHSSRRHGNFQRKIIGKSKGNPWKSSQTAGVFNCQCLFPTPRDRHISQGARLLATSFQNLSLPPPISLVWPSTTTGTENMCQRSAISFKISCHRTSMGNDDTPFVVVKSYKSHGKIYLKISPAFAILYKVTIN